MISGIQDVDFRVILQTGTMLRLGSTKTLCVLGLSILIFALASLEQSANASQAEIRLAQSDAEGQQADVELIQSRLNQLGFNAGSVDGVLGPQTLRAIMAFQAQQGATPTGRLTAGQTEALFAEIRSLQRSPFGSAVQASVENQLPAYFVSRLQTVLNSLGYDAGPETGTISPQMRQAIALYQNDMSIDGGGVITAETVTALENEALAFLGATQTGRQTLRESRPSFDCQAARTPTERAICSDASLGDLDRALADSYRQALASNPQTEAELRQAQRSWIGERDACSGDIACLSRTLTDRVEALRSLAGGTTFAMPVLPSEPQTDSPGSLQQSVSQIATNGPSDLVRESTVSASAKVTAAEQTSGNWFMGREIIPREIDGQTVHFPRTQCIGLNLHPYCLDGTAGFAEWLNLALIDPSSIADMEPLDLTHAFWFLPRARMEEITREFDVPDVMADEGMDRETLQSAWINYNASSKRVSGLFRGVASNPFALQRATQRMRTEFDALLANGPEFPITVRTYCTGTVLSNYDSEQQSYGLQVSDCNDFPFDPTIPNGGRTTFPISPANAEALIPDGRNTPFLLSYDVEISGVTAARFDPAQRSWDYRLTSQVRLHPVEDPLAVIYSFKSPIGPITREEGRISARSDTGSELQPESPAPATVEPETASSSEIASQSVTNGQETASDPDAWRSVFDGATESTTPSLQGRIPFGTHCPAEACTQGNVALDRLIFQQLVQDAPEILESYLGDNNAQISMGNVLASYFGAEDRRRIVETEVGNPLPARLAENLRKDAAALREEFNWLGDAAPNRFAALRLRDATLALIRERWGTRPPIGPMPLREYCPVRLVREGEGQAYDFSSQQFNFVMHRECGQFRVDLSLGLASNVWGQEPIFGSTTLAVPMGLGEAEDFFVRLQRAGEDGLLVGLDMTAGKLQMPRFGGNPKFPIRLDAKPALYSVSDLSTPLAEFAVEVAAPTPSAQSDEPLSNDNRQLAVLTGDLAAAETYGALVTTPFQRPATTADYFARDTPIATYRHQAPVSQTSYRSDANAGGRGTYQLFSGPLDDRAAVAHSMGYPADHILSWAGAQFAIALPAPVESYALDIDFAGLRFEAEPNLHVDLDILRVMAVPVSPDQVIPVYIAQPRVAHVVDTNTRGNRDSFVVQSVPIAQQDPPSYEILPVPPGGTLYAEAARVGGVDPAQFLGQQVLAANLGRFLPSSVDRLSHADALLQRINTFRGANPDNRVWAQADIRLRDYVDGVGFAFDGVNLFFEGIPNPEDITSPLTETVQLRPEGAVELTIPMSREEAQDFIRSSRTFPNFKLRAEVSVISQPNPERPWMVGVDLHALELLDQHAIARTRDTRALRYVYPDDGSAFLSADAFATAEERADAEAFETAMRGFEILGVSLGSDFDQAVATMRDRMPDADTYQATRALRLGPNTQGFEPNQDAVLLHDPATDDAVAIYREPPSSANTVTAVTRTRVFPAGAGPRTEAVYAQLEERHGEPFAFRNVVGQKEKFFLWRKATMADENAFTTSTMQACTRMLNGRFASSLTTFILNERTLENGGIPQGRELWLHAETGDLFAPVVVDPISPSVITQGDDGCDFALLAVWVDENPDGTIRIFRSAIVNPGWLYEIVAQNRQSTIEQSEAAPPAPFDL